MIVRNRKFKRGHFFNNFIGQPESKIVESVIPEKVYISLLQGFGGNVVPLVKRGENVKAGQIIGRNDESVSSPVHATVNGTVSEIKKIKYFNKEVDVIIIESDGSKDWLSLDGCSERWLELSSEELETLIYFSGLSSLDSAGIPTRYKSSIISPKEVEHIIIHHIDSEAYNLSLSLLLDGERLLKFFEGIKILKKVFPDCTFHIALSKFQKGILKEIDNTFSSENWLTTYALEPKYPIDSVEVLIPLLLKHKFPYGYSPANIGIITLSIQTIVKIYEAVVEGIPLIEKEIALCGPGFKNNYHVRTRIGTPLRDIINGQMKEDEELRLVANRLLTGERFSDLSLPVDRTFTSIIALPEIRTREMFAFMNPGFHRDSHSRTFVSTLLGLEKSADTNLHGEERPCIFCSFCSDVCPVNIIPHLIYRYVKKGSVDETLQDLGLFTCIQCKLCSYVCPSKIPLANYLREGQERLIVEGCDPSLGILPYFDLRGFIEYRGVK